VLPKLLFLSFLVGSLTSSSRTISKSFLLSRIDFVDDDDDDEEEEEDKPSSPDSSDAKKNEKQQQQAKRTRRRESKRSRENNTLFQSFRCDSSACNLYVLFEFFSLQRFSLSLTFRVYNPNSSRGKESLGTFSAHEALDFHTREEEEEICSALLLRLIYSRGYTILRSLRGVLLARALEELLFCPSVNASLRRIDFT